VSLAYRVSDSFVVRTGFGLNYLPSNTGYFGGPYYYGNQNFAPTVAPQTGRQYGNSPAGALLVPYNQSVSFIPTIGANPDAPQYYGAGGNEPRFDYDSMKNGKVLQWNFFVEHKAMGGVLSAGYVGTHAYRLQVGRTNVNETQLLPASLLASWRASYITSNGTNPATLLSPNPYQPDPNNLIKYNGSLGTPSMSNLALAMPYPFFTSNLVGQPVGYSHYNALMLQFTRNLSHGIFFNVHYTWSKAMDMVGSEIQNNNYTENGGLLLSGLDRTNYGNTYTLSTNDVPHRLVGIWS
jgi:hypothetical protein